MQTAKEFIEYRGNPLPTVSDAINYEIQKYLISLIELRDTNWKAEIERIVEKSKV